MKQSRFNSPIVWLAVLAQSLTILITLDLISVAQQEAINTLVAAALQVLVAFGVLNNPTTPDQF